ncbi:hypothetical protein [Pseudomonas monteilii]|uniref:hypothetical protein n=1 Tax=Pseudomonas monteilii TaxID=76759 RepID=UPI0018AA7ADB|nr:hypothetical protein [Pseudomonas monteilii]MBF8746844.1 hypothetical protein [Pseudomonas monteilii]
MSNPDWSKCPEATHFDPVDQNFLREVGEALLLFNIKRGWTVPLHTVYGLRVEDCNRPLVKRPPWNGEGFPPPGTVCELRYVAAEWSQATVVFASRNVIVWDWAGEPAINGLCTAYAHAVEIRPIRTPEQISADERTKAINELVKVTCITRGEASRIYDAGYRKQVAP